jgi:hypothetical protein
MFEVIDPRNGKVGARLDGRITLTNFRRRQHRVPSSEFGRVRR